MTADPNTLAALTPGDRIEAMRRRMASIPARTDGSAAPAVPTERAEARFETHPETIPNRRPVSSKSRRRSPHFSPDADSHAGRVVAVEYDDLVDLDVVRAVVLDTARSLHPGAQVQGGEVVFRRVPRQRGVTMNSVVLVDGEPKFFLTIVAGVGNEVLVHELPPGGFTFVVDN
ncbi:hypothetical protein [Rhodococcus qingshengii]|uniref:hypothetical protein n=1 Tax=Rhodococcus TaxID=1827 RepID=UPI001BAE7EA1|nr:hypothetical protein [Rhodococcus qingshengii]MBS3694103.1 hypothetical protein [Rhodococcus qingshengii]